MKILLALADADLSASLATALRMRDHVVDCDGSGESLYAYVADGFCDAVVMDLGWPGPDGLAMIRSLTSGAFGVAVLAVSREAPTGARLAAYRAGADDILPLPVHIDELEARLVVATRRARGHVRDVLRFGPLAIELLARRATIDGYDLHLTRSEFALLEALALRAGHALSADALLSLLYAGRAEPGRRIMQVFICKLRQKLRAAGGEAMIETVWGEGWRLNPVPARVEAA